MEGASKSESVEDSKEGVLTMASKRKRMWLGTWCQMDFSRMVCHLHPHKWHFGIGCSSRQAGVGT